MLSEARADLLLVKLNFIMINLLQIFCNFLLFPTELAAPPDHYPMQITSQHHCFMNLDMTHLLSCNYMIFSRDNFAIKPQLVTVAKKIEEN
jgi:hypothetical protein